MCERGCGGDMHLGFHIQHKRELAENNHVRLEKNTGFLNNGNKQSAATHCNYTTAVDRLQQ